MRFMEDVVDETVAMQPMHPALFDDYLAEGWRLLGYSIIRHSVSICRGEMCGTVPLRIRLEGFQFSKSQRRLLRHNAGLRVESAPIRITEAKHMLFLRHAERFDERRPGSLSTFLSDRAHREPVPGTELSLYLPGETTPVAHSFYHSGQEAVCGTYCFFDPRCASISPGLYLMLLEIERAQAAGKRFYYPGYCYDVPSHFDYKLNFNNLEAMNWKTGIWIKRERGSMKYEL